MKKKFKLKANEIRTLVRGHGGCIATDRITVEGHPVRFMYRTAPTRPEDSGWNFFSGVDEDDEYVNDVANLGVYDVNTIANYDPSIIALLDAPIGSVFEKTPGSDRFVAAEDWSPDH